MNPDYSFVSFPDNLPEELKFLETLQMSAIDMGSNFEITVEKMVRDRIQIIVPGKKISGINSENSDLISFCVGRKVFEMSSQFFNKEVYKALERSYT